MAIALAMLIVGAPQRADAQQPPPGVTVEDPPDFLQKFEGGESAFYFLDEEGNPSIWPGMTFEEIERLKNLESGIGQPQLDYDIAHCRVEGSVEGQRADLSVQFDVDFRAGPSRWVAIPIGLRGFHQTGVPTVEGLDDWRWTVTKESGYVFWARPSEDGSFSATVPMTAMVRSSPDELALTMDLPPTVVEVELRVPHENIEARIQEDQYQFVELVDPQGGDGTIIRVLSAGGTQTLLWNAAELETATTQAVTAMGKWLIRWPESDESAMAEIEFTVENLRGPLESFEIALPSSITVRNETFASNGTVQISASSQQDQTRLSVVPEPETGSATQANLRLFVEIPVKLEQSRNVLQVPPIRVQNAFRERGDLTVEVSGESRLRWDESTAARISRTASDAAGGQSTYEFSYSRMPIDLEMWQEDSQDQVRISPSYRVTVSDELLELEGRITGSALNKTGQPLVLDMSSWSLRDLSTGGLPLSTSFFRIEDERLIIEPDFASSYAPSEAGTSSFDLRFTSTQPRAAGEAEDSENVVAFDLPRIVASTESRTLVPLVESAEVVVEAEEGFKLTADPELTHGLVREVDAGAHDSTLRFRQQAVETSVQFVGYLVKDRPIVAVRSTTDCRIDGKWLVLQQDNQLTSTRQSIDSIPLVVPTGINAQELTVAIGGAPAVLVQAGADGTMPPGRFRIIPDMPLPAGTHEFVLQGRAPLESFTAMPPSGDAGEQVRAGGSERLQIAVPIAFPDTPEATRSIRFLPANLQQSGWALGAPAEAAPPADEAGQQQTSVSGTQVSLVSAPVEAIDTTYNIERLLVRTRVGTAIRHDQATMQLSGRGEIVLRLPDAQDVQILRDGALLSIAAAEPDVYRIPLSASGSTLLAISIWQHVDGSGAPVRFPWSRIAEQADEAYWQVTLPRTRYAIVQSPAAQPAWSWRWETWRLVRVPTMSDGQLAAWIGDGDTAPASRGNSYLYQVSSLGEPWVTSTSSSTIWSLAAVTTLALAALLVYVPVLRTTLVLFGLVVVLCATALRLPDATLLFLQYVLLACSLLVVVAALRQLIVRPHPKSVFGKRPVLQSGSTRTVMRRSEGESPSSTMPQPTGGPSG